MLNDVGQVRTDGDAVLVTRSLPTGEQELRCATPAVLSVATDAATARVPGMKDILAAGKKPSSVNAASDVAAAVVDVVETKAPQQAERKMEVLDASVDGDLEKFAAALKAAL